MSGNSTEWEQIVRENTKGMLRLAIRIVGSPADAEELVQEAFLKAFQYQRREKIDNWGGLLHRFVANAGLDHLRKRRTTVPLCEASLAGLTGDPVRQAEASDLAAQLRREIARLPRQQSRVFCLSELDGRSNHEIAESLGINERAVASALHKARKRLAALMAKVLRKD
jgi:RNA polymerase sigma-70 factor (ECF subfamily)